MRRIAIAAMLAFSAQAQTPSAIRPEFEVVSVKPGDPNDPASSARSGPAGLQLRNTTVKNLVRSAYGLNEYELEGGPKWVDSERFNVDAKTPAGAKPEQIPLMIQNLLADRFKLEFHRETRTVPEYALVVAKGGPKLTPVSEQERKQSGSGQGDRMIQLRAQTISNLARMLISAVGAPVVDRTELDGQYTFTLRFSPLVPREDDTLPSIFDVLQEQLGLKLERTKGPIQVLVINRVEKPSDN